MEQQFKDELDEAPYIAKLRSILGEFRWASGPAKVLDFLYLGSEDDATDLIKLRDIGITHVVNCAAGYTETSQEFYGRIKYHEFEAEDDEDYNIMQHFKETYQVIEEARKSGGKALVHCLMGINRSGALVTAYVMVYKNLGPISAAKFVKKSRPQVLSNHNFQRQLVTYARVNGMLRKDKGLV